MFFDKKVPVLKNNTYHPIDEIFDYNIKIFECQMDECYDFYEEGVDNIKYGKPSDELVRVIRKFHKLQTNELDPKSSFINEISNKYDKLMLLAIKYQNLNIENVKKYGMLFTFIMRYNGPGRNLINYNKHIYKAAKYTNMEIFTKFLSSYEERVFNGFSTNDKYKDNENLDVKILLKNANKNLDYNMREYVNFIFKDCDNIYPAILISDMIYSYKFTKQTIKIIKSKYSIYKNNFILNNYQDKISIINEYFNFGYFKYANKDILNIITSYMIDYDIEYHYFINIKYLCDDFMNKFNNNQQFKLKNSRIIEYENSSKMQMPAPGKVCACCYIKYLEKILNENI